MPHEDTNGNQDEFAEDDEGNPADTPDRRNGSAVIGSATITVEDGVPRRSSGEASSFLPQLILSLCASANSPPVTLLVPFDDSPLSRAALERAGEFAAFMDQEVVALAVIPENDLDYAEERGWLTERTPFTVEAITDRLERRAREIAPNVRFRHETIADEEGEEPVATRTLDVVRKVREVAQEEGATVLFLGSENAGRVASPLSSVGNPLSEDDTYDVHIVRHA
jgi:nucleotide-binding universal stress UspA family protein